MNVKTVATDAPTIPYVGTIRKFRINPITKIDKLIYRFRYVFSAFQIPAEQIIKYPYNSPFHVSIPIIGQES
jgi:hypothetical protein